MVGSVSLRIRPSLVSASPVRGPSARNPTAVPDQHPLRTAGAADLYSSVRDDRVQKGYIHATCRCPVALPACDVVGPAGARSRTTAATPADDCGPVITGRPAGLHGRRHAEGVTASVLDMTDDGRWVAVSTRRGLDNAETDNRRYGDPTYVSPSRGRGCWSSTPRRARTQIAARGPGRHPPGRLVARRKAARHPPASSGPAAPRPQPNAAARLQVWDVGAIPARRGSSPRRLAGWPSTRGSTGRPTTGTSSCRLRSAERIAAARGTFKALTDGPIIVHSAKDPFLEWDELGTASTRWRSIGGGRRGHGRAVRTILPERKISPYTRRARRLVRHLPGRRHREDRLRRDRRHRQHAATTSMRAAGGDRRRSPRRRTSRGSRCAGRTTGGRSRTRRRARCSSRGSTAASRAA